MEYVKLCEVYKMLENTSKGLAKREILSKFFSKLKKEKDFKIVYLLQGRVFPDYEEKELGISIQLTFKAISQACGIEEKKIVEEFKILGDAGLVAEKALSEKKQKALFQSKLTTEKVLDNLRKLSTIEGKGAVEKKIDLIVEIFHSCSPIEAKYFARTLLGDLKIGVGNGQIREAIVEDCFSPKDILDRKKFSEKVQGAYDKTTDFAEVFERAVENTLDKILLSPGKPVKVMLFPKAKDIADAFEIVGKPAAFEYKYDGFRVMINKDKTDKIRIFTRRLEDVTKQFPELAEYAKKNIDAKSFIIDGEAIGFDSKTKKFAPFQFISRRIKRKYDI